MLIYRVSQKMSTSFSSCTYSSLNQCLYFLAHNILIFLASKYNFLPHLSSVATLANNILSTEQVQRFPQGGWF